MAQVVKKLPTMQDTWIQSLGWKDLEKGMATNSSILAWRIQWDRGASCRLESWGRKEPDLTERLSLSLQ